MEEFYIRLFKVLSHQSFPLHKSSLNCSRLLDIQVHVALQFGLPRQLSPDRERFPSYHLYPQLNTSSQLANLIRSGPWGDLLAVPAINNTTFQLLLPLHGFSRTDSTVRRNVYKTTMQFTQVPPYPLQSQPRSHTLRKESMESPVPNSL